MKCMLVLLLLQNQIANAQTATLKGQLVDSSNQSFVFKHAVAILSDAKTGYMYSYKHLETNSFSFDKIPPGTYKVLITFPMYADFSDQFELAAGENKDLGNLQMFKLIEIMKGIIIKANNGAIRIKGDTTLYLADSFKVKEGANIEDLLKKMPGLQVDKNGQISANGKKVDKVLVDGEEFFGDDPTVATKNMDAKVVDKIAVYDSKVETGGDENTQKVLDIRLKESAKKGYFGKLSAGSDFKNIYETRAMYNNFNKKRKISFVNVAANSPNTELDFDERVYTNSNPRQFDEESGFMWGGNNEPDDVSYSSYNSGLPTSWQSGVYYADKFAKNKLGVTMNANYRNLGNYSTTQNNTTTLLSSNSIQNIQGDTSNGNKERFAFGSSFKFNPDTIHNLEFGFNINQVNSTSTINNLESSKYSGGRNLNFQKRSTTSDGTKLNLSSNLKYKINLKRKKGDYLQTQLSFDKVGSTTQNNLQTTNKLFFSDTGFTNQLLEMEKDYTSDKLKYAGSINYNRILTKILAVNVGVSENYTTNDNSKFTLDKLQGKKQIDSLSSDAQFINSFARANLNLKINLKKSRFNLGLAGQNLYLKQTEVIRNYLYDTSYFNLLPSVNWNYKPSQVANVNMNYSYNVSAPSPSQVQPLTDNSDPFNLVLGNPLLSQKKVHSISGWGGVSKVFKNKHIWSFFNANYASSDFASSRFVDTFGRTVTQTINVKGNWSASLNLAYNKRWNYKKYTFSLSPNLQPSAYKTQSIINKKVNNTLSQTYSGTLATSIEYNEKVNFTFSVNHSQNYSNSSLQNSFSNKNWTQFYMFDLNITPTPKWEINATATFNQRQKTNLFATGNNNLLINATLDRRFLKDNSLVARVGVHDLLNQNFGYQRSVYENYVVENQYNTFKRIIYFQLTWNFKNKIMKGAKNAK